ncbi:MAG: DUF1552 domain-containing protein [Sandaracinaceae bacterium]
MAERLGRRTVLRGLGGVALSLPFLEGLSGARADATTPPYALFLRQANGGAAQTATGPLGLEPERFWPRPGRPFGPEALEGRALMELVDHADDLLVVGNVNMMNYPYGDGHPRGVFQLLTAAPPVEPFRDDTSQPAGESLAHRIGRELNPDGRESLYLWVGAGEVMGGPVLTWRGPGQRRSAIHDPAAAYRDLIGGSLLDPEAEARVLARRESVNDLLRAQLDRLRGRPELSAADRRRLDTHREAIRDVELRIAERLAADTEAALEGLGPAYASTDGDDVHAAARLHLDVAALALASGVTRAVTVQVGDGFDGSTRYRDPRNGQAMENYHFVSHRRLSHGGDGTLIADAGFQHHEIDKQFARTFRHLLDRLAVYEPPDGGRLLDAGVSVWCSELGRGAEHTRFGCPFILAGSCGGFFRTGRYVILPGGEDEPTHPKMLNTIGTAVGLRSADGGALVDFGGEDTPKGVWDRLLTVPTLGDIPG